MVADYLNTFSDGQAVTTDVQGDKPINLIAERNIGAGQPLYVKVYVNEPVTAAGAATVNFKIVTGATLDANDDIVAPVDVVGMDSGAIAVADMAESKLVSSFLVKNLDVLDKYLNVSYVVGTGPLTAGSFTVEISPYVESRRAIQAV